MPEWRFAQLWLDVYEPVIGVGLPLECAVDVEPFRALPFAQLFHTAREGSCDSLCIADITQQLFESQAFCGIGRVEPGGQV